jgi:hypothetical protein
MNLIWLGVALIMGFMFGYGKGLRRRFYINNERGKLEFKLMASERDCRRLSAVVDNCVSEEDRKRIWKENGWV